MKLRGHGSTGGSVSSPLTITSTAIPLTGEAGSTYDGFTVTGHGGTAPYTYSIPVGTLPPPLALNSSTGAVPSATLSTDGNYGSITIRVTDSVGATADLDPFTIIVAAAPSPTAPPADITPAAGDGTVPTESAVVYGSGFTQKAIAAFDEHASVWIESNTHYITVGAAIGDRGGIAYVDFWLNGNVVRVSVQAKNTRTNSLGFCVNPKTGTGADGDYTLYARVVPTNGYERLISIPITLNSNGTLSRAVRYCDYTHGSNSNSGVNKYVDTIAGGGASANNTGPFKTTQYAISQMTSANGAAGGIIKCHADTYVEDTNSHTDNPNTRMIRVTTEDGGVASDVTIKWASRTTNSNGRGAGVWQPRASLIEYKGVTIETSTCYQIWAKQASTTRIVYNGCTISDANGVAGPVDNSTAWTNGGTLGAILPLSGTGYGESPVVQSYFKDNEGQQYSVIDCTVTNYLLTSPKLIRNTTATIAADAGYFNAVQVNSAALGSNTAFFNYHATISAPFPSRRHVDSYLTLATAVYNSGTGRTTITWSGSPSGMANITAPGQGGGALKFLTGANVGQAGTGGEDQWYGGFHIYSQTASTFTTIVTGNCSTATGGAVVGDTARAFLIFHCDPFQFSQFTAGGATNYSNIYCQGYSAIGDSIGNIGLINITTAAIGTMSGTLTTTGTAFTTSASNTIVVDDFLRVSSGAQLGESRRVVSYNSVAKTGVLASAFSVNQSAVSYVRGKSVNDVALVNCILSTRNTGAMFQWQHGGRHVVLIQSDVLGGITTSSGTTGQFYLRDATISVSSFGCEDFAAFDSVFEILEHESAAVAFPTGFIGDNNAFRRGTGRGTNSVVGSITFDATYHPTAGLSKAVRGHQGHATIVNGTPLLAWDFDGNAITSTALVGARQA